MPNIRDDFSQPVAVDTQALPWIPSPVPEIERRMLDRIGDEVARATSLVRYAPESRFPSHTHAMGEEFLVLEGVFEDEHGAYPPGTYVRNPWGTSHAPFTQSGCTIFVKLRQMDEQDQTQVVINTVQGDWTSDADSGISKLELHSFRDEHVRLERWAPGTEIAMRTSETPRAMEMFILEGAFEDADGRYGPGFWLRRPPGHSAAAKTQDGCRLLIKWTSPK